MKKVLCLILLLMLIGCKNVTDETSIQLKGNQIITKNDSVLIVDNKIYLTKPGTYRLTGSLDNGEVIVEIDKEEKLTLILDNASIKSDSSPIYLKKGKEVTIELVGNNYLEDGKNRLETEMEACLYSKVDTVIKGSGNLEIKANYQAGIKSNDNLIINGGIYTIDSVGKGIVGKDSLTINSGNIDIKSNDDALKSTKGEVVINSGIINIEANGQGIHGETDITINSGIINIEALEDGMHCGNVMSLNSGEITIDSLDDALHSDYKIVNNAILSLKGHECIEAALIYLNGIVDIISSEDGINASGGGKEILSEISSELDKYNIPQKIETEEGKKPGFLFIQGGEITIKSQGDGIDSNHSIIQTAGKVIVEGPSNKENDSIDFDGRYIFAGGELLAFSNYSFKEINTINDMKCYSRSLDTKNIELVNTQGKTVVEYTLSDSYRYLMYCSKENMK